MFDSCALLKNHVRAKRMRTRNEMLFSTHVQIQNDKSRKNNNKMARISEASALATMQCNVIQIKTAKLRTVVCQEWREIGKKVQQKGNMKME